MSITSSHSTSTATTYSILFNVDFILLVLHKVFSTAIYFGQVVELLMPALLYADALVLLAEDEKVLSKVLMIVEEWCTK